MLKKLITLCMVTGIVLCVHAQNGYDLWLNYYPIEHNNHQTVYKQLLSSVEYESSNATQEAAFKELQRATHSMLQQKILKKTGGSIQFKKSGHDSLKTLPAEGYILEHQHHPKTPIVKIYANDDAGFLYGTFRLLREIQLGAFLSPQQTIIDYPAIQYRILNHWDNLDRTVERGYAGFSLWNWHTLPDIIEPRYFDYARANASIGINAVALTNVNSNALILTPQYLEKVKALADVFRTYNIKIILTARFSAPIEIGGLSTADPLDPKVQEWWNQKTKEIYQYVPDFAGFLVKANSEGQPGPQDYGRSHADGANLLAKAVAPHGGIVMWRAFVYSNETPEDRFKQAYNEFQPLDGKFEKNVIIQVKNGPIDFQPREPFHPLFGAMPKTPLMMEFQITQEYLGMATHMVYLAPMYKEVLEFPTYLPNKAATVAKIITGEQNQHSISAIAGVTNIGNDVNWTGHPLLQSNWYAYGRLAWNPYLSSEEILNQWIKKTFPIEQTAQETLHQIMMDSWETLVQYMTPLGLHHIMGWSHHFGPAPWIDNKHRADWTSVYYHKADSIGIGFDRTVTGSNALAQYAPEIQQLWGNTQTIDPKFLLWFHRVNWDEVMPNGKTVWENLCNEYDAGVNKMKSLYAKFKTIETSLHPTTAAHIDQLLKVQVAEAKWWRDACLAYFQSKSKRNWPKDFKAPEHPLEYYIEKQNQLKFVPGI